MPLTNLIVNGTFSSGSSGWNGTDIEINPETAYIPGNNSNRVSEIDGATGQTTVLQQSFSVSQAISTTLTFDTALRTAANPEAGSDGFRVEILDNLGNVIATQDFFPTANSLTAQSLPVNFPNAGTFTLRFTELGGDDSLGAIVDNISILVCFTDGTLITTRNGLIPVEDLREGDMVLTLDNGFQPIRWIKSRKITRVQQNLNHKLRPVRFVKGSLGNGLPLQDLRVSRQHRMLISDWRAQMLFAADEILTPAVHLINGQTISEEPSIADVTYYHFMFDAHQVVMANGVWAESFLPTETSLKGLPDAAREELFTIFPELAPNPYSYGDAARPIVAGKSAQLLMQNNEAV